jgi:hypothetical protein
MGKRRRGSTDGVILMSSSLVMWRTQSFDCALREGVLLSILERASVVMPAAAHASCSHEGAPYCDYLLTCLSKN